MKMRFRMKEEEGEEEKLSPPSRFRRTSSTTSHRSFARRCRCDRFRRFHHGRGWTEARTTRMRERDETRKPRNDKRRKETQDVP